jgi:lipopolysaccharide/colanic/teichoic acid biosynthesis glycosyltransferase
MLQPLLYFLSQTVKALGDRMTAALLLILLSPLYLGVALLIYLRMGRPIVFAQSRPGKDERIFEFYKFRTMREAYDDQGNPLPDRDRILPFGHVLRQTSLDELPQLWNVLIGDMSFVGPRPLVVKYLGRYSPEQARRHTVKPGITGLAQVSGRNAISWEEKFKLDVWYIDQWSLWLDIKILILTVLKVVQRDGVNQEGFATSEEFWGTLDRSNKIDAMLTPAR